jgi:hypothetical protein
MANEDDPSSCIRRIHEELWDESKSLARTAPGATPGIDLSGFNLHSVRETVLGAFLDLENQNIERAKLAISAVLPLQFRDPGMPWDGSFPVAAEQDPPRSGAVEWYDYDPNWRQFIGCLLALIDAVHGESLGDGYQRNIREAIRRCVAGEPESRIPEWYTNPRLMHAWLTAHSGRISNNAKYVEAGETLARAIETRFIDLGELDEYNSPTYDGIDLFALALWVAHPPSDFFATAGRRILDQVCNRISDLFHPGIGSTCGPYIRCYGVDLHRYVSLNGLWFFLAFGRAARSLPPALDAQTRHVHDLYFLPVFSSLIGSLSVLEQRPVAAPRYIEKRFDQVVSRSELGARGMVGWEHGRRHEFAFDQYTPFVMQQQSDNGETLYLAIKPGAGTAFIDCKRTVDAFVVTIQGPGPCSVRLLSSDLARIENLSLEVAVASLELVGSLAATTLTEEAGEHECLVEFLTGLGAIRIKPHTEFS